MGANFTPSWNDYKSLKPFRFWCQKVLPTVYDDALSYYELLCKVVAYLNTVMEELEKVEQNTDAVLEAFNELQSYVNNYFDITLPQLVDDAIDGLVEDGTFDRIIDTMLQPYYEYAANAAQDAEAWARGTRGGVAVGSDAEQYHNNSKYYAEQSDGYSEESEAWARGTVDGVDVGSSADQYHNNSKYYAEQAAQSATDASTAGASAGATAGENAANAVVDIVQDNALEACFILSVHNVEVKAQRTMTNAGQVLGTVNIPGLISINIPISKVVSTPIAENEYVRYGVLSGTPVCAQAKSLRENKYVIQYLNTGYYTNYLSNGKLYENFCFTVFDVTTGQFAADGTTLDIWVWFTRNSLIDFGTARNEGTLGT